MYALGRGAVNQTAVVSSAAAPQVVETPLKSAVTVSGTEAVKTETVSSLRTVQGTVQGALNVFNVAPHFMDKIRRPDCAARVPMSVVPYCGPTDTGIPPEGFKNNGDIVIQPRKTALSLQFAYEKSKQLTCALSPKCDDVLCSAPIWCKDAEMCDFIVPTSIQLRMAYNPLPVPLLIKLSSTPEFDSGRFSTVLLPNGDTGIGVIAPTHGAFTYPSYDTNYSMSEADHRLLTSLTHELWGKSWSELQTDAITTGSGTSVRAGGALGKILSKFRGASDHLTSLKATPSSEPEMVYELATSVTGENEFPNLSALEMITKEKIAMLNRMAIKPSSMKFELSVAKNSQTDSEDETQESVGTDITNAISKVIEKSKTVSAIFEEMAHTISVTLELSYKCFIVKGDTAKPAN